jgi:hypothetical protein
MSIEFEKATAQCEDCQASPDSDPEQLFKGRLVLSKGPFDQWQDQGLVQVEARGKLVKDCLDHHDTETDGGISHGIFQVNEREGGRLIGELSVTSVVPVDSQSFFTKDNRIINQLRRE